MERCLLKKVEHRVLKGFTLDDLDQESLTAYRQHYKNLQPDHPWTKLSDLEFLIRVGGYRQDRTAGIEGLTRAGLLMFGQQHTIKEALPYYMLDYQERVDGDSEVRWIDRITPDGTWPGNLFEFYLRVSRKLTADLKVPFQLIDGVRQAETLVHKVLREALVNMLIHADYTDRASIRVIKRPDRFEFRNPGLMRVPIEKALQGGESDCRNRILQDLFRYIGFGESAGSGLPKILDGWAQQHWRKPLLHENSVPYDQTLLELHMLSLLPEEAIQELRTRLGEPYFNTLTDDERLILVTALIEKAVDHQRMMTMLSLHPRDLSALLSDLVDREILVRSGTGRGTVYSLAYDRILDESEDLSEEQLHEPEEIDLELLRSIAAPIAAKQRASTIETEEVILELCSRNRCTKELLATLLNRSPDRLKRAYLTPLVKSGRLQYQFPSNPHHPRQTYQTSKSNLPGPFQDDS